MASLCLTLSVAALGHALQLANGFYDPSALAWLTAALGLCALGVLGPRAHNQSSGVVAIHLVMVAAVAWQVTAQFSAVPGMYLDARANLNLFKAGVAAEGAIVVVGALSLRALRRVWFPALLFCYCALGLWMLEASPAPHIDVVVVHRDAIDALLGGRSPYAITFQNIYGAGTGFYNPAAVSGDKVLFGYPYPPVNLLLAIPGHLFAGDYRYAQLAAMVIGAGLIGFTGPATTPKLAAALFLTQPRAFFVLEQGWTEPAAVLVVALATFLLLKKPSSAGWIAGLVVVTKQYLLLAAPLLLRFAAGRRRTLSPVSLGVQAIIAAAILTVPFVLWSPAPFLNSVVLLQLREPFRIDSLSYLSWAARANWGAGSFVWALAAGLVALAICAIRTPNSVAGFAGSLALSTFAAFAFGSKAFCNYYFFVAGAMCCAISALASERPASVAALDRQRVAAHHS